jgi:hypothetical protein
LASLTSAPAPAIGSSLALSIGTFSLPGAARSLGSISNSAAADMTSTPLAGVSSSISSSSTGAAPHLTAWSTPAQAESAPGAVEHQAISAGAVTWGLTLVDPDDAIDRGVSGF